MDMGGSSAHECGEGRAYSPTYMLAYEWTNGTCSRTACVDAFTRHLRERVRKQGRFESTLFLCVWSFPIVEYVETGRVVQKQGMCTWHLTYTLHKITTFYETLTTILYICYQNTPLNPTIFRKFLILNGAWTYEFNSTWFNYILPVVPARGGAEVALDYPWIWL